MLREGCFSNPTDINAGLRLLNLCLFVCLFLSILFFFSFLFNPTDTNAGSIFMVPTESHNWGLFLQLTACTRVFFISLTTEAGVLFPPIVFSPTDCKGYYITYPWPLQSVNWAVHCIILTKVFNVSTVAGGIVVPNCLNEVLD